MASYRLFLWSRDENRLEERMVATDTAGLLDTFDRIGRSAVREATHQHNVSPRRYLSAAALDKQGDDSQADHSAGPACVLPRLPA
ncbi:hypothetical protein SAMN06295912_101223 [Sphingomonas laterariae]|uniref:Uncharacterized protein n=1 Tax=Edaphosphingomonas laterariae TaxID=861865 RepID=A0A239BM98_9SPHN|nr:hypothetical protein [Sphingomonas laterariae]SNS08193.1 hypothetical protein SAMN06295912_101223 [Sphingomonas laterariae]